MRFISTRGGGSAQSLSNALALGLAEDGGLFVPETFPSLPALPPPGLSLADTATQLIAPFFEGDALAPQLAAICTEALNFEVPVQPTTDPRTDVLELFHGPTAAFKDVGARFLAACFTRLPRDHDAQPLTILVATSGDTGGAVAAAFHQRAGFRVVVLYPDGRVSPRQAHQLSCFGDNIHTYRVAGSFDDCQRMVKAAFADAELRAALPLSSANSISLGRLLPQMSYYAHSALAHQAKYGELARYVIPTGNLGNALACLWARRLGLPIGEVLLATNANRVLPEFIHSGEYRPRDSVSTLANAMDVGAPSNLERLRHWLPEMAELRGAVSAAAIDDDRLSAILRSAESRYGHTLCPHTAAAFAVIEDRRVAGDAGRFIAVATAHPAKFDSVVEPLVGHAVPVPAPLAALLARPAHATPMAAEDAALKHALLSNRRRC
jgi:threonine synthase